VTFASTATVARQAAEVEKIKRQQLAESSRRKLAEEEIALYDAKAEAQRKAAASAQKKRLEAERQNISAEKPILIEKIKINTENNNERYEPRVENNFISPLTEALSTFSIDVDGAGYSNMRRFINQNELPPVDAVKLEEMVNYFNYSYPEPDGEHPFSISTEYSDCPWNKEAKLLQIGLKAKSIDKAEMPKNNLVFLLDVSGSMDSPEKLALLKKGFRLLVKELRPSDKVSIAVYAGASGLVLPATPGSQKDKILDVLDNLTAGGSTAGGEGIKLAYKVAKENFIKGGNNRVILATDGDFNVGLSDDDALIKLIEKKREDDIFLSVMGFGTGNLQDGKIEKIADNGNGNYSYIDNILEAKKVLVTEMGGTLLTVAKDVKLQLEFNPTHVKNYRLIGYENRLLEAQDFNDDTKDAGEIGAGHTVTALYEIIPGDAFTENKTDLKYQTAQKVSSDDLVTVKFRYKAPTEDISKLITKVVKVSEYSSVPSDNLKWASTVAEAGLVLRNSRHKSDATISQAIKHAIQHKGEDPYGYRQEFILLLRKAEALLEAY